jgi:cytochrome c oxidase cbb3-type subunit 3/ubiquinol-cytochrome c reductase cytochrome c subunit
MRPHLLSYGLLALASSLAIAGCRSAPGKPGPDSGTPRPEQVLDFATLYGQNCAACHGENGRNGAAISLANPTYLAIAGATNIQRVTAAGVAGTAMPPFAKSSGGMLTDQQISVLAQSMAANWSKSDALADQPAPTYASSASGNPAQGEKTFAIFCARCHGADGTGAALANGLKTGSLVDPSYLSLISDQGLRSMILAGQTEQGPHDWRSYSTTHALTDAEITDTVAWLASHRSTTPGQVYRQHP